jgi:hypothetical protein
MSELEFRTKLGLAVGMAEVLGNVEGWDDLADQTERAHTTGPFIDPTAYMVAMDRLTPMADLFRAVAALVRAEKKFREAVERTEAKCAAMRKAGGA